MRVDDDPLRLPELGRDDVRRLARDARQPEQLARSAAAPRRRTPRAAPASCRAATSSSAGRSRSRRCRARAPPAAPRGSPRAGGTSRRAVSVTRLTFTSVVCAESITETSSSSGLRKRSAIVASACSTASRSMIGRIRSLLRADALAGLLDEATRQRLPAAACAGAGRRRRGREPGSRRTRSRSASAGTRRPGCARSRPRAPPRARARRRA